MTAIPDYPKGRFFDGYGIFRKRRETVNGVRIHRSLIIPRMAGRSWQLALNYLSYTFFASLKAFWFGLTERYDAVIVHETSPVMVGIPAVIIKKLQKVPVYFWVLDLWPESLSAAGGIKNKRILSTFETMTKWIYRNCKTLLLGSKGYKKSITRLGPFEDKLVYFPNWIDELEDEEYHEVPSLPEDKFNVVFTGNIGDAQDFVHVVETARLLKDNSSIRFFIVGDGRKREWLEEQIRKHSLDNIKCLGRYPISTMRSFYRQSSVLFLALKDEPIFSLTAPAKLQAYMSSGRPIVGMINGDGAELIKEADCGWAVQAEDSRALADLLLKLSNEDKKNLDKKGQNGKIYSETHFDFKSSINKLEYLINNDRDFLF